MHFLNRLLLHFFFYFKLKLIAKRISDFGDKFTLQLKAIQCLVRFAEKRGYFKSGGCHICLNLNDSNTMGYLHLSADSFYEISPSRETFLENFKNLRNYSVET